MVFATLAGQKPRVFEGFVAKKAINLQTLSPRRQCRRQGAVFRRENPPHGAEDDRGQHGFSDASFQATLGACIRKLATPVIYLEASMGHKAVVKRKVEDESPRLFAFEEPPPELRAVRAVANEAALSEKFVIPQNMRLPESSVIRSLFKADGERDAGSREDMAN